jgi:predicted ATPase/DNA-binding winged helix-turn-helix (wHTH) protein/class 3 adenylate cyclase
MAETPDTASETLREWARDDRITLAIVFTDIVGSTALGRALGDEQMNGVRRAHFGHSRALLAQHAGREIKTIGDSVMAVFRSIGAALDYAHALYLDPGHTALQARGVRAGIHIGSVDVVGEDIFGTEVDVAARVVDGIEGAEIWLSDQAKRDLERAGARRHRGLQWLSHDGVELKGIGPESLWSLVPAVVVEAAAPPMPKTSPSSGPAWVERPARDGRGVTRDATRPRQFAFGPFRLLPAQQLLLESESPVRLGSRARDLLIALVEQAGQVITKEALSARLWPNIVVEEGTLRVHVAALRKALRDGQEGRRYIANIAGRGYAFVGEVAATDEPDPAADTPPEPMPPPSTGRLFGRAEVVETLSTRLAQQRLITITITGPGGIGKTSVALAVADRMRPGLPDGVCVVDFAPLADSKLVPTALASALGIGVLSDNPLPSLVALLRRRDMLIVLDNCEHVIDAAALLAESLLQSSAQLHILATSREPIRVPGEVLFRLAPLAMPEVSDGLTAPIAMTYSAVQLFAERAAMCLGEFPLTDAYAPAVANICRRLDGIPLAIDMAAGRVDAFGIAGLASALDDRFRLAMPGRRTALPRHQTLSTTLDWSYQLLPETERLVLRRLAVFAGFFTIAEATGVIVDGGGADILESIANLAAKSLVVANLETPVPTYRLLETTRAYALQKLEESGERAAYARRHARQCLAAMEAANAAWEASPPEAWLARYRHLIDDVRAALDLSFRIEDEAATAAALTIAALPLWYQLSLLSECYQRACQALRLPAAARSPTQEMRLYAAIAWLLMQTKGFVQEALDTWTTLLALSRDNNDPDHQLRALWGLWAAQVSEGALRTSLALAKEFSSLAQHTSELDRCVGDRMLGHSLHLLGEQAAAREHLERMLANYAPPATGAQAMRYIFDQKALARCFLARIRWLQGYPDQAMEIARDVTSDERAQGDALSLCQVLVQAACPIGLMVGDLAAVEEFVSDLIELSVRHDWHFWHAFGSCFRGVLTVHRGDLAAGLHLLEEALRGLRSIDFGVHYLYFLCEYASALGLAGRIDRGLDVIEQAIARSDSNNERWCIAEVLRIKGELLHRQGKFDSADAAFATARGWAERQSALSLSLRIATGAARLWQDMGRTATARTELTAVCGRFTEGFGTADYRNARAVLDALNLEVARR